MEQFALNFAPDVTVPEPQRLREKVKNALKRRWRNIIDGGIEMEKNLIIRFLTTEAIKTPDRPKHKDRLWDAIRKAHRDVMTGARTGNISKYAEKNKYGKDETLEYLYQEIRNAKEPLSSSFLIQKLQKNDGTIEFAAIQKLVNMTLKYLIILNECEGTASVFDICEEKCDCPVDSTILKKLARINKKIGRINGNPHKCWTNMDESDYIDVQNEIQTYLKKEYPQGTHGNIWFDFLMWKVD